MAFEDLFKKESVAVKEPEKKSVFSGIFQDKIQSLIAGGQKLEPLKETTLRTTPELEKQAMLQEFIEKQKVGVEKLPEMGKSMAQSIARSFLATGQFIKEFAITPYEPEKYGKPIEFVKEIGEKTYTPQTDIEKKIFGTDKPVSFRTIGEEVLAIGGEDFKNKWGKYSVPVGMLFGVLDITPFGVGKKQTLEGAAKIIAKTDDVVNITKTLKTIVKGSDEEIEFLAKSLKLINKEEDVLKIIQETGRAKEAIKVVEEFKPILKRAEPRRRAFLESVSEARPEIKLEVGGKYIPRSTDGLAIKARTLIKEDIISAEKLVRIGTDEKAVATASELIKHYTDEAVRATTQASKNVFYEKAGEVARIAAKNLTEQGRAVQAASIMGRLTPEGILRFATSEINKYNEAAELAGRLKKKIPNLTAEQIEEITATSKKIMAMPDGTEKAMAFRKLYDRISDLIPSSWYQKVVAVWKAGLLTGMKTSGLNIMSNLFHGVSEIIKDVPATAIDSVASLFTGKRTLVFAGGVSFKAIKEGFGKGWRYLKTGFDERNVGIKLDWRKVNFGKSKFAKGIQAYEETVFHILGAEDQPFYYGAKARSLQSQAIAQAKNQGLRSIKAKKFIENLMENPTDEMLKYATADAEMAVFQNPTLLGRIAKAAQRIPGGEFVVPFGRTPSAVANQLINYSPIGIVKAIVETIYKGNFDQRLFSQAVGRGITGTAIMFLGTELWKKKFINTDFPTGERERELWKAEGRTPNSIKIGDKYRNVNVLGPAGFLLVVGANFQESLEKEGSIIKALGQAVAGGAKSLTEQTFLQGLKQIIDSITDPERFITGYFKNTIASVIPTLISDIARVFDPYERRAEGILGGIKSRIPKVRETLEPQIDILGRKRERGKNAIESMIDPSRPSRELSGPVIKELRRLFDAGLSITPTQLGDKTGYKILTPEQNTRLWQKSGEIINSKLTNLLNLDKYKNLKDDQRADVMKDIIDKSHLVARVQAVMELTQGLEGEELKTKLSQLKKDGLMTREVFKAFMQIGR